MEYQNELKRVIADLLTNHVASVSLDCVIFGFHAGQLKVLLLRWKGTDEWMLPGGRIRHNEDLDAAAHRSLCERTGLTELFLQQFYTFGSLARHKHLTVEELVRRLGLPADIIQPVTERVVSVGYYALVDFADVMPTPDFFTDECRWWAIDDVPGLLFDHNEMISVALKTLRRQLRYQPLGYALLPEKFTMPDLQQLYETVLGQSLDRRNFQKQMLSYGILERLDERKTGGAHKAPYLYRFNKTNYDEALEAERGFAG